MADGGPGRPPYASALALWGWGRANLNYIDGRLILKTGRGVSGLTLREFCNVVYAFLADGRDEKSLMQLDMALAPTPEAAQETVDQANARAMRQLRAQMGNLAPPMPRMKPRA